MYRLYNRNDTSSIFGEIYVWLHILTVAIEEVSKPFLFLIVFADSFCKFYGCKYRVI